MNLVVLTGRIGVQPEIRTLNSGDKVANFSLATEQRWRDRQSGEKSSRTPWRRVVTYAPGTVKFLEEYVDKGDLIQVVGMLRNESWQDPQRGKRQATKIAVTARTRLDDHFGGRNSRPWDVAVAAGHRRGSGADPVQCEPCGPRSRAGDLLQPATVDGLPSLSAAS